jgi:hypothetical protein
VIPNPVGVNRATEVKGQNVLQPNTAEKLAVQHGVTSKTIVRDGQFAKAVETVKAIDPQIEIKVVQGKAPAKGAVVEAAKVIDNAKKEVIKPMSDNRAWSRAARIVVSRLF